MEGGPVENPAGDPVNRFLIADRRAERRHLRRGTTERISTAGRIQPGLLNISYRATNGLEKPEKILEGQLYWRFR